MQSELICFVRDGSGKAAVTYVSRESTLDNFRKEISNELQLSLESLRLSYQMKQFGNSSVHVVTSEDFYKMLSLHLTMECSVIEMDASSDPTCASSSIILPDHSRAMVPFRSGQQIEPKSSEAMMMDTVRIPASWHDSLTGVGQTFTDAKTLRIALTYYSIAKNFVYRFKKNDRQRITVVCDKRETMNCTWRLHASPLNNGPLWAIKKFQSLHMCGGGIASDGHPRASRRWVASLLQSILKHRPAYRPVDAKKDIKEQYGINVSYSTAWHGKEIARRELYGSWRLSYDLLRWYQGKIMETNPGSFVNVETCDDDKFRRMFVCFRASYDGFIDGCRPLLFLDGTFIKDRSKGTLLAATAYDGNNGLFPLAFCICDSENLCNWEWFLAKLSGILFNGPRSYDCQHELVFVSDSDKGLKEGVRMWFPEAHHSFCILHIAENFRKSLMGLGMKLGDAQTLAETMKMAAYKYTYEDFSIEMTSLRNASQEAHDTLLQNYPPQFWANSLFPGVRYGHVTSNVAESYNNWIRDARQLPILQMLETIRVRMMERFHKRRQKAETWTATLCPNIEEAQQLFQKDAQIITPEAIENVKAALASSEVQQKADAMKRAVPCKAAGQTWEDPTLADWPENDFRLFCGDLGNEVNDDVLTRAFSRYPSFNMARVIRDKRTGKTKGYGFVSFANSLDLVSALKEMNGKYVGNRPIKLRKSTWKNRIDIEALEKQKSQPQKKPKLVKKSVLHK